MALNLPKELKDQDRVGTGGAKPAKRRGHCRTGKMKNSDNKGK
jgi:hypothetical protein